MSVTTPTVTAAPSSPAAPSASLTAPEQTPGTNADAGPIQSFTEVLSRQTAGAAHEGGGEGEPSNGAKPSSSNEGQPWPTSAKTTGAAKDKAGGEPGQPADPPAVAAVATVPHLPTRHDGLDHAGTTDTNAASSTTQSVIAATVAAKAAVAAGASSAALPSAPDPATGAARSNVEIGQAEQAHPLTADEAATAQSSVTAGGGPDATEESATRGGTTAVLDALAGSKLPAGEGLASGAGATRLPASATPPTGPEASATVAAVRAAVSSSSRGDSGAVNAGGLSKPSPRVATQSSLSRSGLDGGPASGAQVGTTSGRSEPEGRLTIAPTSHPQSERPLVSPPSSSAAGSQSTGSAAGATATSSLAEQLTNSLDVERLSGAISRPLLDGNGTYTVQVAMHPADLGHLQVVMSLAGNDLQVSITPQTQVGHAALANAVDSLKNHLARGGVNVNVTLHDPGSQSGGKRQYPANPPRGGSDLSDGATTVASPSPVLSAGQIHLVL